MKLYQMSLKPPTYAVGLLFTIGKCLLLRSVKTSAESDKVENYLNCKIDYVL